jgi:hypothetical protein
MGCNGTKRMEKLLEEANKNLGSDLEVRVSSEEKDSFWRSVRGRRSDS